MRKLTIVFILLLTSFIQAQEFTIPSGPKPYYDIIEWKGMGGILMSKDPSGNTKQINLTLIGDQQTSIWDQKFNPKGEEFYYLASENARYVYFLDNLELNNGKVYFSQLNSAGNVKTTSVALGSTVKPLGVTDYNDLELVNVVVTDKALIHHFRYVDKKAKAIKEIATFITHHNFRPYAVELGSVKNADLKNDDIGQWYYIGFTGDQIYFAARDLQSKKKGWSVKEFTSKAKLTIGTFMEAPDNLIPIEDIGFGTTGKYYLEGKSNMEAGLLTQINSKFYMMGAQSRNGGADVILYELSEGEWKELNSLNLNYFIENKTLKLGIYALNEGIGYHLNHNGYDKVSIIKNDGETTAHNDFTDRTIFNPSSVLHKKEQNEFVVDLPNKVLYFDTKQLDSGGDVTFELKAK